MITKVEALHYRCLRFASQSLKKYNILVGPNASGKTTFLDTIAFLGDIVRDGSASAVKTRTDNVTDLFWNGAGSEFELAVEALIPTEIRATLPEPQYDIVRYEIRFGLLSHAQNESGLLGERVYLKASGHIQQPEPTEMQQRELFPQQTIEHRVYSSRLGRDARSVIHKVQDQNDNFYSEMHPNKGKGWMPSFKFGSQRSALGNLPDDGTRFPVSTWLKQFLSQDVQELALNSRAIRRASPPGQGRHFMTDGSNLPWVVDHLRRENPTAFADWVAHVQVAWPDIEGIDVREHEDTKYRFIVVNYAGGIDVPSWMLSDGTLRFFALTILAYLEDFRGVYLIEEPENGIHPKAIHYLFESLASVRSAQLLLATHSPVVLGLADPEHVLCFAKCDGATDIVSGSEHPALRDWQGEVSLGLLFASGILG